MQMPTANVWRKVNVIGHVNPDTDSICSAIAYAYLKNQASEMVCEPRRAGQGTAGAARPAPGKVGEIDRQHRQQAGGKEGDDAFQKSDEILHSTLL